MTDRRSLELSHDDGVNAWRSSRIDPPSHLRRELYGYSDYWERTGAFTVRRELPHAEGVLIVNLGDPIAITGGDGHVLHLKPGEAFVAGAHLRPALSQSNGTQAGIHVFLPLVTLRRLLAVPMDNLIDSVVPLDALLGRAATEWGEALGSAPNVEARTAVLDRILADALLHAPVLDPRQSRALLLLRTQPDQDIAEIADAVGWSRKHLAARVRDAIGVGPRSFRRLVRFQTLTGLIDSEERRPDWAGLAVDAGYYDQSHMIREFREFSDLSPSAYLARMLPDGGGLLEA